MKPSRITSRRRNRRAIALSRWSGGRRWIAAMAGSRCDVMSWCPTSLPCPSRSSGRISRGSRGWKANVTWVTKSPPKCATTSPPSGRTWGLAEAVRGHWGIENSLHWVLDVTFREDDSRLRSGYGAENFAVIRHLALNLLKRELSKGSLKRKRYKAALSNEFRSNVLFPQ